MKNITIRRMIQRVSIWCVMALLALGTARGQTVVGNSTYESGGPTDNVIPIWKVGAVPTVLHVSLVARNGKN